MVENDEQLKITDEYIENILTELDIDLLSKKEVIIKSISDLLISKGFNENQIKNKMIAIGKIVDKKQFCIALNIVRDTLKNIGTSFDCDNYDGLIVKKLPDSDIVTSNKESTTCGQTDIRPNKEQENIFPYLLSSESYIKDSKVYNSLKNYFLFKINVNLNESNLDYLKNKQKSFKEDNLLKTHTTILNDNRNRLEISSQQSLDGEHFLEFRRLLYKDDYLVVLKRKKSFDYDFFGIKIKDNETGELLHDENGLLLVDEDNGLSKLDGNFYYYDSITLISSDMFDKVNEPTELNLGENRLLYGVPGSGKSWKIKNVICRDVEESCIERVVFHPDYTYSDFIGQILPKVTNDKQVKYEFICGPFTDILRKAYEYPTKMFYLIIEEINRGNAPAIFGDIFQLLDRMDEDNDYFKKGTSEFPITNADIAEKVYHDKNHKVRIPSNLSIIATMNTSDQNVFTLDTAFQRRWHMEIVKNCFKDEDEDFKNISILNSNITWEVFCNRINDIILDENALNLSSEDKRLGVHFVNENELKNGKEFSEKVLKYLWDDAFKFNRDAIFKKEYKSLEDVITDFTDNDKKCFDVFKDGIFETIISYEIDDNLEEEE